jgi:hypothetical protein
MKHSSSSSSSSTCELQPAGLLQLEANFHGYSWLL